MVTVVLTWVGAVLGLMLLVAMAAGAFVVDFDEALRERRVKARSNAGPTG
jgi:NADH:ubiquinone oxidoreductase subunit 6 (subunit J)